MEELNAIYERMRTIFSEEAGFVPNDGCDAMVRLYALASEVQALLELKERIAAVVTLRAEERSKFARGLALLQG